MEIKLATVSWAMLASSGALEQSVEEVASLGASMTALATASVQGAAAECKTTGESRKRKRARTSPTPDEEEEDLSRFCGKEEDSPVPQMLKKRKLELAATVDVKD